MKTVKKTKKVLHGRNGMIQKTVTKKKEIGTQSSLRDKKTGLLRK